jgi:hypothetical protein
VNFLIGGWFISGTLAGAGAFRSQSEVAFRDHVKRRAFAENMVRVKSAQRAAEERLTSIAGGFDFLAAGQDDADTVTLVDCVIAGGGLGGQLKVPVLRVVLSAVDAWWVSGTEFVKASGGTAFGAFVGFDS